MVRVKSTLNGDIRRLNLGTEPKYATLEEHIGRLYEITDFKLLYRDDEGDSVTMNSDVELAEAVEIVGSDQLLRIEIVLNSSRTAAPEASAAGAETARVSAPDVETSATRTETAPSGGSNPIDGPSTASNRDAEEGPSTTPIPARDASESERQGVARAPQDDRTRVMDFVSEMVDACMSSGLGADWRNRRARGMGMRGACRGMGTRVCSDSRPSREWARTWRQNEENFRNFLENLDLSGLCSDFASISSETMQALRELVTALLRELGLGALMGALPVALSTMRAFLAELGGNADAEVSTERVDALAADFRAALTHALGAANATRVGEFVRTAGCDPAVIRVLRRMADMGVLFNRDTARRVD